ncbi:hypothetical protein [Pseudomonas monteilii]|uniref:Uncharacterized protein n=1 Tax=Pseudomonas monteilii TaxID=76759 RepID=A0A399MEP6_9PSED|nr:hypothetical protein [Pseudomonas monteilii]RII80241.1 hypothetical protein D0894_01310 [Pseudomonas monteilii]
MSDIQWDEDELQRKLAGFFCEFFGMEDLSEMPMHEVRARAELAGTFIGRALAVIQHKGPVGSDIAMTIRSKEQIWKTALVGSVGQLCTPGGELREKWNRRDGIE